MEMGMANKNSKCKWKLVWQTKMDDVNGNGNGKQKWLMQMEMGMANKNGKRKRKWVW